MWPQTANLIFRNISYSLTDNSTDSKESKVFVQVLNINWNIPICDLEVSGFIKSQLSTNQLDYENLEYENKQRLIMTNAKDLV